MDSIVLPLRWRVATRLPTFGHVFSGESLAWPEGDAPVLLADPVPFERLGAWSASPELVFLETSEPAELLALAEWAASASGAALAIVSGGAADPFVRREALARGPGLHCVERAPTDAATLADCARQTEALLSQAVCAALVRRLHREQARLVAEVEAVLQRPAPGAAPWLRPRLPPLTSLLSSYARSARGVWWSRRAKPAAWLGVSPGKARRLLQTAPAGIGLLRRQVRRELRVWLVEDDPGLVRALRQALPAWFGQYDAGEPLAFASGESAVAQLASEGPPDVALVDIRLAGAMSGVEVAQRLGAAGGQTVILGKTGEASDHEVRALHAAGALGVYALGRGGDLVALLGAGLAAARAESEAGRLEDRLDQLATALEGLVTRGLAAAAQLRALKEIRALVSGLEAELVPAPLGLDDDGPRLDVVRRRVEAEALRLHSTVEQAAAALGVHARTLARLRRSGEP